MLWLREYTREAAALWACHATSAEVNGVARASAWPHGVTYDQPRGGAHAVGGAKARIITILYS
jgi:hypothetical protein